MIKVVTYRERADECRRLARQATHSHMQAEWYKMADAWDQLAEQREEQLAKKELAEIDLPDRGSDSMSPVESYSLSAGSPD
jgi:hypothetical protein